jgi:hypothetical protein
MMRNKGLYTGAVALIAVAIIIASSFSMVSTVQSHQRESFANNIVESKWQMQNAKHLTGLIVSDAMADSGFNLGCNFNLDDITITLGSYLAETFNDSFSDCTVEVERVVAPAVNQIRVNIQSISCSKEFEGISINYEKQDIEFNKQISYYNFVDPMDPTAPPQCYIDVWDPDALKCEVDTIEASVPENIC